MSSQKKSSLKRCLKCGISLRKSNWNSYDKNCKHYICKTCRKIQDKTRQASTLDYSKKQTQRYRMRRSAVIFYYGNECVKCHEDDYTKLTVHRLSGGYVDINYLYNNLVDKDEYQILCCNCRCEPSTDKYALENKKAAIAHYGVCCSVCNEDNIDKLTLNCNVSAKFYREIVANSFPNLVLQVFCFNCNHSRLESLKYPQEELKTSG